MTNDYKKYLLEFITGKLIDTERDRTPQFSELQVEDTEVYTSLSQQFTHGFTLVGKPIKCKNASGENNGITALYGYYEVGSGGVLKGFIALLNEKFELIDTITQYTSGTDLSAFGYLDVDETGNLYGVDKPTSSQYCRFILLSNPSVKVPTAQHYSVKLRTSYYFPDFSPQVIDLNELLKIVKQPNGSNYFIYTDDNWGVNLKINVGSENEWTKYSVFYNYSGFQGIQTYYIDINCYWDTNEELTITYIAHVVGDPRTQKVHFIYKGTNDSNNVIQMYELYDIVEDFFAGADGIIPYGEDMYFANKKCISGTCISSTHFYLTIPVAKYDTTTEKYDILIKNIECNNNTTREMNTYIYEEQVDAASTSKVLTETQFMNEALFVNYYICDNYVSNTSYFTIYTGIVWEEQDQVNITDLSMIQSNNINTFNVIDITNVFNLYIYNALVYDYDESKYKYKKMTMVYNPLEFCGIPYIRDYILEPKQIFLYDEDDNIIFARSLYNKTIYNNTTEATFEVPNTMLNDEVIATQDLIGRTMYVLCSNTDDIQKNIYETLYINYFITLLIQNRNTSTYVDNLIGSNKVNNAVHNNSNMENQKMAKIRVNYVNGDTQLKNVNSITITNDVATIEFQFTVLSDILNIEILSNDEDIVYQTITNFTNYDIGKTYVLSQECYVE